MSLPSSPARKGSVLVSIDKKLADAGMASLVASLNGAEAIVDTTSVSGVSAVFFIVHRLTIPCIFMISSGRR